MSDPDKTKPKFKPGMVVYNRGIEEYGQLLERHPVKPIWKASAGLLHATYWNESELRRLTKKERGD